MTPSSAAKPPRNTEAYSFALLKAAAAAETGWPFRLESAPSSYNFSESEWEYFSNAHVDSQDQDRRFVARDIAQPARKTATPSANNRGLGPSGPAVNRSTSSSHIPMSCAKR